MARSYLCAKAKLTLNEQPYVVDRQCDDGTWLFRHTSTGRILEQTTSQVFDAYACGTLKFQGRELRNLGAGVRRTQESQLSPASAQLDAAKLRMAYVRAISGLPRTQSAIEQAIDEVWHTLEPRPASKPGWVSVYRWLRAYIESGENPASLLAAHVDKGNRETRYESEVLRICQDVIERVYLTAERPTVEHVVHIAKATTRRANSMLPESQHVAMPTRRLVQRLISEIPAFDKHAARYGREAARKKFRTSAMHRLTDSPLQRGEMDHTRMDVFVVDDVHGLPLGRPWLTVLLDDYTRCVLGFCLSFEPPSRATVARCLRHAFMPKTQLREQYPDLKNDWMAFGVVSELVMDGGVEFHSEELEQICFELNIEQHFSPRKTPWFKGKVERFQGTLNRGVAVATPGKTFEGIVERDDYDPKKHAVVAMSTLMHITVRWIVDVYHQKTHSALGCSPAQMWANMVKPHDIALVDDPLRFDAIVGGSANRILSHKGIEYAGLVYNSPEMGELRRHLGDRLDVVVRIDRSNLGSVIVLHPERGTPYRVPCLRPDYAEGLTEWQHGVCKRYAREKLKADGDVDVWLDSLLEISDIVERELRMGKRKGATRERMARWSQNKPAAGTDVATTSTATAAPFPALPATQPKVAIAPPAAETSTLSLAPVVRKHFTPVFEQREPTDE